jgi:hypothetical protein
VLYPIALVFQHFIELFSGQAYWRRQDNDPLLKLRGEHIKLGFATQNLGAHCAAVFAGDRVRQ